MRRQYDTRTYARPPRRARLGFWTSAGIFFGLALIAGVSVGVYVLLQRLDSQYIQTALTICGSWMMFLSILVVFASLLMAYNFFVQRRLDRRHLDDLEGLGRASSYMRTIGTQLSAPQLPAPDPYDPRDERLGDDQYVDTMQTVELE